MRRTLAFRAAVPLVLLAVCSRCHGMMIAEGGRAQAVIVIGKDVPETVRYAAEELAAYIEKVSDARLPLSTEVPTDTRLNVILVGGSDPARANGLTSDGLSPDGYRMACSGRWLALVGRDSAGGPIEGWREPHQLAQSYHPELKASRFGETGTLFAVYHFLERFCGVRWYMPGELGEVVPKRARIEVPDGLLAAAAPDFEYRFLYDCYYPSDPQSARWHRRIGLGAPYPVVISHSFDTFAGQADAAPACFAVRGAQRDTRVLCLSEPKTLDLVVSAARSYFGRHPEQRVFAVVPNDGYYARDVCQCELCQAQLDPEEEPFSQCSNYVWGFVNAVAKEVRRSHPDRYVGCLAYESYSRAPSRLERLEPNACVMYAGARLNQLSDHIVAYQRRIISDWLAKTDRFYMWNYYCWNVFAIGNMGKVRHAPVFFPHIIQDDLRYLKRGGCRGEFIEAETWPEAGVPPDQKRMHLPGLMHLNLYLTAKLYWDTTLSVDELLAEYYAAFYGPAESGMRAFWTRAEELWMTEAKPGLDLYTVYSKARVEELVALLDRSAQKASAGSPERLRIDLIRQEMSPLLR